MSEFIIARNKENLKGIFYYSDINYKFIAETGAGNISQLSRFGDATTYWTSSTNKPQVLIKFSCPVLITNYSIIKNCKTSYPVSFILYGKRNGRFVEIDKREDQKFDGDTTHAYKNITLTYQTKSSILTREVLLKNIENSHYFALSKKSFFPYLAFLTKC